MVASLPQIQVLKPPKRGPVGLRGEEGVYKWGNAPKKGPVGLRGGEGVCKYTLCFMQMGQCLEGEGPWAYVWERVYSDGATPTWAYVGERV